MGFFPQTLPMMFIIILLFIAFNYSYILIVGASLNSAEYHNIHIPEESYCSGDGKENHNEKVSGNDVREDKEIVILEKFRALLGLKSFNKRKPSNNGDFRYGSPSPSPLPSIEAEEAPAPSPLPHIHSHSHPSPPHPRRIPGPHIIHKENREKDRVKKKVLIAGLVSAGSSFILLCVLGLFCFCQRFKKQRKRSRSANSICCTPGGYRGRSKCVSSQNSVKKVSSDPGPDLFYLESLGSGLEPQPFCLKQNAETMNTYSNQNILSCDLYAKEVSDQEVAKSEYGNDNCDAVGEIMSVHESQESIRNELEACNSSSGGDKIVRVETHSSDVESIVPMEAQSSDDESFHSFCDSHSCNSRVSNASARSLIDTSEIVSPNVLKLSPSTLGSPVTLPNKVSSSQAAPPPPPPPPPYPRFHISPSHSSSAPRLISKLFSYSTLENSVSSSVSNQSPLDDLPPPPPNLPKPAIGIPPPPCPPPFSKGNDSFPRGPPPIPSQFSQHMQLGKDGGPLPKLKPLHWDKVRAAPDRTMVWDKLRSSSFELDEQMIESLFGYNLQSSLKNEEVTSKTPSPNKHVLEPKRLQNLTILSKALNVTAEQVCYALIQGRGLSLQQLEALVKMEPTKEEAAKLSNYKEGVNKLGSAEKFVKAMLNVPFAFQRIEAMLYRETFEDEVVHLKRSFLMLEEACKELRSSRLFLKLLEAVLKTGNRMNVGTTRGGARAFKLDALLKLADVKGTDGKTTLLHFVVQEIIRSEGIRVSDSIIGMINQKSKNTEEREEEYKRMGLDLVSGLSTELCNAKKTATIDLDVLSSSVSNLSEGITKLQHLVSKDLFTDENSGNFVQSMRSFLNYAQKHLKELQEDEHRVLILVREITEYFHGSLSKDESNPLRIFVIVRDFLGMLDHVCKELRSLKVPRSPNPLAPFR